MWTDIADLLHVRVERESDNPFASNHYYDPTPTFLRFRAVPRGSGWAVLNELLTSELGRRSIPTRPELPDRPQPRRAPTSACSLRRADLGRCEPCGVTLGAKRYAMPPARMLRGSIEPSRLGMLHAAHLRACE